MLTVVPGISAEKAVAVVKRYKSIKTIMEAYDKCKSPRAQQSMLADIQIVDMDGRVRKLPIGGKLSKKIWTFLCSTDHQELL